MNTDERAALAAALHDSYLRDPAMPRITWDDLNEAERGMWYRHAENILAALDGWTLVRGGGDVIERGIELARQQRDEIDRLQTALAVYGRHHRGCPVIVLRDSGSSCACGFRAALVPEAPRHDAL